MSDCSHEDFWADVEVNRVTGVDDGPVVGFTADVTIKCVGCGMPFCFRGMKPGLSYMEPRMSLDAKKASLPIHPEDDPTFGIGVMGFDINIIT